MRLFGTAFLLACLVGAPFCWSDEPFENTPKLTLAGHAVIRKPADQLCMTVGAVTIASDAETALKNNNEAMQGIVASLQKIGLTPEEYETGRFNIRPLYSQPPKYPPPDWKPSINGYEVTNSVAIKTPQIKLAGTIIDAASKSGANSIDSIRFELKEMNAHREEAIAAASAIAIKEAETLAKATGQSLVRLLLVRLDDASGVTPMAKGAPMFLAAGGNSDSLAPIQPGSVEVSARVTLVYEIAKGTTPP